MFTAGEKSTGHDVADETSNGKIKKRWKNKTEVNCKKVLFYGSQFKYNEKFK